MRGYLTLIKLSLLSLLWLAIGFSPSKAQTPPEPSPISAVKNNNQNPGEPQITSPEPGQVLRGSVPVVVDTTSQNFESVELTFMYEDDPSATWFLIHQGVRPVTGTLLVLWDTTTITDGNYTLRMTVNFAEGRQIVVIVSNLRVRNYTKAETETPAPIPPTEIFLTSTPVEPTAIILATAAEPKSETAAPVPTMKNPASIQPAEALESALYGALWILGIFAIISIISYIRSTLRNK